MALFGIIFVGEIEQKQAIWCLKLKSLNINFLFIEPLYKINITLVIMLTFGEKEYGPLHVILTILNDKYIPFQPTYLELCDHSKYILID